MPIKFWHYEASAERTIVVSSSTYMFLCVISAFGYEVYMIARSIQCFHGLSQRKGGGSIRERLLFLHLLYDILLLHK